MMSLCLWQIRTERNHSGYDVDWEQRGNVLNLCVILHVSAIHFVVIRCSLLTFAVTVFFRCLGCTSEGLRTRMHTHTQTQPPPPSSRENRCSAHKIPILRPSLRDWPVAWEGCWWPNLFLILGCRVNNIGHGLSLGEYKKLCAAAHAVYGPKTCLSSKRVEKLTWSWGLGAVVCGCTSAVWMQVL